MEAAKKIAALKLFANQVHVATGMNVALLDDHREHIISSGEFEGQLFNFFLHENLYTKLQDQAQVNQPILFSDRLDFNWLAEWVSYDDQRKYLALFGPVFIHPVSIGKMDTQLLLMHHSHDEINMANILVKKIPTILPQMLNQYAIMLHYLIYQTATTPQNFASIQVDSKTATKIKRKNAEADMRSERQILDAIRDGNLNYREILDQSSFNSNGDLLLSSGTPLRDGKDTLMIFCALGARAAMDGGMPAETAQKIQNNFLQAIEDAATTSSLETLAREMLSEYVTRVHEYRQQSGVSSTVLRCCDYIQLHAKDDLNVEQIAQRMGYTKYYFTKKFYAETGIRLKQYINQVRIREAQILLTTTNRSVQYISEELHFGTRNYFTKVFHKVVGMGPWEYRKKKQNVDMKE